MAKTIKYCGLDLSDLFVVFLVARQSIADRMKYWAIRKLLIEYIFNILKSFPVTSSRSKFPCCNFMPAEI